MEKRKKEKKKESKVGKPEEQTGRELFEDTNLQKQKKFSETQIEL